MKNLRLSISATYIFFFLLSTWNASSAQELDYTFNERRLNSIQVNLLGYGTYVSLNYERQFELNSNFFISAMVGLGVAGDHFSNSSDTEAPSKTYLSTPHHLTLNIGKGSHFFEFGYSASYFAGNREFLGGALPLIGYRYSSINYKMLDFRVFTHHGASFVDDDVSLPALLSIGFCVGINF